MGKTIYLRVCHYFLCSRLKVWADLKAKVMKFYKRRRSLMKDNNIPVQTNISHPQKEAMDAFVSLSEEEKKKSSICEHLRECVDCCWWYSDVEGRIRKKAGF